MKIISTILDLYAKRNNYVFDFGAALLVFGVIICTLGRWAKDNLLRKCSRTVIGFSFGIMAISILVWHGNGRFSLTYSNQSATNTIVIQATAEIVTNEDLARIQNAAVKSGVLNVRVHGLTTYVDEVACSNFTEFKETFDNIYTQGLLVTLVDDYADYVPFTNIKNELNSANIRYITRTVN